MESSLHMLVARSKDLEKELALEIQEKEEEHHYKIFGKRVTFEEWVKHEQKALVQKIVPFIRGSTWPVIMSAPIIWSALPPALLFDLAMPFASRSKASPR